jgi:hypothetical protein
LKEFIEVLGEPSKTISAGGPPPAGHRNNQIHFYDEMGISLNEHHATCLIQGVNVVFEPKEVPFPTQQSFGGELLIGGKPLNAEIGLRDFLKTSTIEFHPHLGYCWFSDGERISISLMTYAEKLRTGRQSRIRRLSYVALDFRNAHKMSSRWSVFPPE